MTEVHDNALRKRRQRAKNEGTFLEHVRDSLLQLAREVADIKASIADLKVAQLQSETSGVSLASLQPVWDNWSMWYSLGCDQPLAPDSGNILAVKTPQLRADAQPFDPPVSQTIGRSVLLQYRTDSLCLGAPLEIAGLRADDPELAISVQSRSPVERAQEENAPLQSDDSDKAPSARGYCQWVPCRSRIFANEDSQLNHELQVEAATVIQRFYHNRFIDRREVSCNKCKEPANDCQCLDIWCRVCSKVATYCSCLEPAVWVLQCTRCESKVYSSSQMCPNCAGNSLEPRELNWLHGAIYCNHCGGIDEQWSIQPCSDAACRGAGSSDLFHLNCMVAVDGLYFCPTCSRAPRRPQLPEQDEEDSSSDEGTTLWSNEQTLEFIVALIDEAVAADTREVGARKVWTEWATSEKHVPEDMRQRIVEIIDAKLQARGFPSRLSIT